MNLRELRRRRSFLHSHAIQISRFETLEPRLVFYNVCSDEFAPCTHEAMTAEGLALYYDTQGVAPTLLSQEIRSFAGKVFEGVANPDQSEPFALDPIYGNGGLGGGLITIDHFWNPDADIDAPMEFNQLGPLGGEDDYPNAFGAAQAMWSRALGEYAVGNKAEAYRYLGMVAHFLGDQTIPTHVHGDTHGPDFLDYDAFEEWMSVPNVGNPPTPAVAALAGLMGPSGLAQSRALLTQTESDDLRLAAKGILNPTAAATEINDQLLWVFLNTNQVADFFASDGGGFGMTGSAVDGDTDHPSDLDFPFISGWAQAAIDKVATDCAGETNLVGEAGCPTTSDRLTGDNDNHGDDVDGVNDNDGDLSLIRKHSFVHGIRAMGSLFKLWEQAISTPIVNVTIERIEEVGIDPPIGPVFGMDGIGEPDYYVGIVMGYNRRLRSNTPAGAYLHDRDGNVRNINGENMAANLTRRDAFLDDDEGGTEDQSEVAPNYRFGQSNRYPTGSNAYVPGVDLVDISLVVWENDETIDPFNDPYDSDDPADINPEAGRVLTISVDLANCVSRTGTQVTIGGSQHSCGVTIIKAATDDDENDVQVNLKIDIFVPNRPPTAEAGGPYTVAEGGSVQVSGAGSSDPEQLDNTTLTYAWDLDNNGSFETSGISPTFSAAGLDGPSSRTVRLRVTDNGMLSHIDEATIIIENVPADLRNVVVTPQLDENGVATLSGNIFDPGTPDTFTLVVDWGGGPSQTYFYPAGTMSFSETHRYLDDNPTATPQDAYNITLNLRDDDSGTDSAAVSTLVKNVNPDLRDVMVTPVLDEDGVATLSGNIVDPGTQDTFTLVVNWGEGASQTYSYPAGTTSFSETHRYLDDNPTATPQDAYNITLNLRDDDSGTDSAPVSTLVKNVNPVVTAFRSDAVECGDKAEGDTVHVVGAFTDVGTLDTHSATIAWGDGAVTSATIVEAGGAGTIAGQHIYSSGGIFRIVVTLTDDDTGQTTERTFAIITGVGILDGQLQAVGTKQADDIKVNLSSNGQFVVHASFLADSPRFLPAAGVKSIAMILCDGDDHATIASKIALPTYIAAEEGNDEINGGSGPNILLGGEGDDRITGGSSHDILVGGDGADRIVGNGGDDILIAGTLGGAADPIDQLDAMLALLAEWDAERNRTRLRLKMVIGGDDDADKLTGSSGDDWFFFEFGEDTATDLKRELAENLG